MDPKAKPTPNPSGDKKEAPAAPAKAKDAEENKFFGVLAYLGILFLVPLLAKKDSPFAQFHAKQGMVICIGWIILSWIPFINFLAWVVLIVLAITGIVGALGGKQNKIPVVGDLAEKINL